MMIRPHTTAYVKNYRTAKKVSLKKEILKKRQSKRASPATHNFSPLSLDKLDSISILKLIPSRGHILKQCSMNEEGGGARPGGREGGVIIRR